MTAPIVLVEVASMSGAPLQQRGNRRRLDATPNVEPELAVPGLCERFGLTFPEL